MYVSVNKFVKVNALTFLYVLSIFVSGSLDFFKIIIINIAVCVQVNKIVKDQRFYFLSFLVDIRKWTLDDIRKWTLDRTFLNYYYKYKRLCTSK